MSTTTNIPETLDLISVLRLTELSLDSLHALMRTGHFPPTIQGRAVRWYSDAVIAWIRERDSSGTVDT